VWLKYNNCKEVAKFGELFPNDIIDKEQCVLFNTTTDDIAISWYASYCWEKHHFVCTKMLGKKLSSTFRIHWNY